MSAEGKIKIALLGDSLAASLNHCLWPGDAVETAGLRLGLSR